MGITAKRYLLSLSIGRLFVILPMLLLLFFFSLPLFASATANNPAETLDQKYQQAKFYYNQLQNPGTLGDKRGNWIKGTSNFRRIYLSSPKSTLAPSCLYMLGKTYYKMYKKFGKKADLEEAISYYSDTASLFPGSNLADDALFAKGNIYFIEFKDPKRAAIPFSAIVSQYASGDMHPWAANKLKEFSKEYNIPLPKSMIGNNELSRLNYVLPVKYWSSSNYTRVVIKTSGPVTYKKELLEKQDNLPRRLYIDFKDSYIEPQYRAPVPIKDGLLQQIRTGQFSPDTVRVVLDIESISDFKIFSLPDPFRVVIDVRGTAEKKDNLSVASVSSQPLPEKVLQNDQQIILLRDNKKRKPFQAQQRANHISNIKKTGPAPQITKPVQIIKNISSENSDKSGLQRQSSDTKLSNTSVSQTPLQSTTMSSASEAEKNKNIATRPSFNNQVKKQEITVLFPEPKKRLPLTLADNHKAKTPISLAQQLGLGIRTIVIDPGHGGKDPGAMAFGLKEKDIVLQLAKKLANDLRDSLQCEVLLTRNSDTFISLEERTAIANSKDADLFISLHINAHPSPKINGLETYFLNLTTNEEAMRVAARENATSTHQMSDLQDILSDIMKNSKINESSRLAQHVHNSLLMGLNKKYGKVNNLGVKQAPFYVLIGAEMPAILLEIGFISNPKDAKALQDREYLWNISEEISDGIRGYIRNMTATL